MPVAATRNARNASLTRCCPLSDWPIAHASFSATPAPANSRNGYGDPGSFGFTMARAGGSAPGSGS